MKQKNTIILVVILLLLVAGIVLLFTGGFTAKDASRSFAPQEQSEVITPDASIDLSEIEAEANSLDASADFDATAADAQADFEAVDEAYVEASQ